jgi:hypothetical protein
MSMEKEKNYQMDEIADLDKISLFTAFSFNFHMNDISCQKV